jgi:hypothetical protein
LEAYVRSTYLGIVKIVYRSIFLFLQAERGFAAKAFFVMFLVKGAERRGQWITGAQKDLPLRWLWIY